MAALHVCSHKVTTLTLDYVVLEQVMRVFFIPVFVFLGLFFLGLGVCEASDGLKIMSQKRDGIVIWYNPDEASGSATPNPDLPMFSADEINTIADDHCRNFDMDSVPLKIESLDGGKQTTFMCMEPANCQWCSNDKAE